MKFDILTIFPNIFDSYLKESFIQRARRKGLIKINVHDLRRWAKDKRKTVDDRPFGGGLGMVLKIEPIFKAVSALKKRKDKSEKIKAKVILFTPRGRKFDQKIAYKLSKIDQVIMICGRYEGVDERAARYLADIELSIGDYDLMGGELPAMVVMESVARLIPGVLGKPDLLKERITKEKGFIEYPQYTRPEVFTVPAVVPPKSGTKAGLPTAAKQAKAGARKKVYWRVPKVLISGNHKKIGEWRKARGRAIGK